MHRSFRFTVLAALAVAAPLAAQDHPQGLLPDTAVPSAYRLDLTIVPERERFSGHAEIDVVLKEETSSLYLHGRDLKMAKAIARIGKASTTATYSELDSLGVARLDFAKPLKPGKVTLAFDYDAPFGSSDSGLYHVKVADQWYAWTQFESIDARAAFPSFDQPGYKTPFTVSITTAPGLATVSNAPETGSKPVGALVRHDFAATRPLPTYLIAFAVGPFAIAEGSVPPTPQRPDPLPLRVVATQPNKDRLRYALDNSQPILALLERYFNEPFPFPKLDQIASPAMNGAMENAGADIYGDPILLLDEKPPVSQQRLFGMVIAHELSHQWFGDLVTPQWWDDLWLNESFANWMGYRIGNEWRPDLKIGAGAIDEALQAMSIDALAAGRPIHQPIATNGEIDSAFDAVTYGKGGQVVAMIAAFMGDEKFRDGVRLHLSRHPYGNATTDDFFGALADAAGDARILAAMKSFVDQQGVPVVSVAHAPGGVRVSQARYHLLGSDLPATQWSIPLCLRVEDSRECSLLDTPAATIAIKGRGAIMPNAGGTGYYRFTMSDEDWSELIDGAAGLAPGEALALNDSLWADVYAGHADPALLVAAARAMTGNTYSEAATEGGVRLDGLRQRGLITAEQLPAYRAQMAALYAPMLARLGLDPKAGVYASDDPDQQQLRVSIVNILSGAAQVPAVQEKLVGAATSWLGGQADALDQAFYGAAFDAMVGTGGQAAAATLLDRALASEDALSRSAMLGAVGGSGNPAIGQWLLGQLDREGLRPRETVNLIRAMMAEPATRANASLWMIANFDRLIEKTGIFVAAGLPTAFRFACSMDDAARAEAAMRPMVEKYQRGSLELARTLEQIRSCAALHTARGDRFASLFK